MCAAFAWLTAAVAGVAGLSVYQYSPDPDTGTAPPHFPARTSIELSSTGHTLLFFAHPKCPCTRASVNELARLMADTQGRVRAYVVLIYPNGAPDDWMDTDLRSQAERIPGVQVLVDIGEKETEYFDARTSGTVLLYDRRGELKFRGGITAARGHEGDNKGRDAIFRIVTSDHTDDVSTPAFGCPLRKRDCTGEALAN